MNALTGRRRVRFELSDHATLAITPLVLSVPFTYWPRVIEGDTQPWVVLGAAVAFLFYWPADRPPRRNLWLLTALAAAAAIIYAARAPEPSFATRYSVLLITFALLCNVASRGIDKYLAFAIKITIVTWFLVAVFQITAPFLGYDAFYIGRFVAGRSGVPSLTAESSFYGSLSVLHVMYLKDRNGKTNRFFIALAALNVVLSGSLLAYVLLLIPVARASRRLKLSILVAGLLVLASGLNPLTSPVFRRLADLELSSVGTAVLASDPSTNYRFGHINFIFNDSFRDSLIFSNTPGFELGYNTWAARSGLYLPVESDAILPSGGELVYRSGIIGLLIVLYILFLSSRTGGTKAQRLERTVFIVAALLNPISLSNPVLIGFVFLKPWQRSITVEPGSDESHPPAQVLSQRRILQNGFR